MLVKNKVEFKRYLRKLLEKIHGFLQVGFRHTSFRQLLNRLQAIALWRFSVVYSFDSWPSSFATFMISLRFFSSHLVALSRY